MIRARKRFGQHFLQPEWIDKLIRVIQPAPQDAFLEIGPGRGALTVPLAARVRTIKAYEIDRDLARELAAAAPPNVTVVAGDFLDLDLAIDLRGARFPAGLRIAGNLPYNVAAPILFKLVQAFSAGAPLGDATLMLQREVADRLLARPGTKQYGVLGIIVGHLASVERLLQVPPGAFRPAPKVSSSVVRLRFHEPLPRVKDSDLFRRLVQAVFTRRRKTIENALLAFDEDAPDRIPDWLAPARRPETLSIDEFARLADHFTSKA
jgi:16S rRNA (adenine1518-N6/adenine1519-N6)-dimethyltransferase